MQRRRYKEGLAVKSSRESSTSTGVGADRCFPFVAFWGLGSGKAVAAYTAATTRHAFLPVRGISFTLYTVDATEYVTAQIDATFHEGRGKWRAVS